MEFYLIRHTQVNIEPGPVTVRPMFPLAASFPRECERIRCKLPHITNWKVYSSPLHRCHRLAESLNCGTIVFDPRLMELNFGAWELKTWSEIETGQAANSWFTDFVNQRCPQGESFQELLERSVAFWEDLCQQSHPYNLVMTHGGVIRALLSYFLNFPLANAMRITIDYGSVTKVRVLEYGTVVDFINR